MDVTRNYSFLQYAPRSRKSPTRRQGVLLACLLVATAFTTRAAQAQQVLLIANATSVGEYDASTGATLNANFIPTLGGGIHHMVLDGNNHLFVSNSNQSTVSEYNATTGAIIKADFISGLNVPFGLAVDGNNHLFVANTGVPAGTVGEYNAITGATINATFINANQGLASAYALALDGPNNHLFVADSNNNNIAEFDATTGATVNYGFLHTDTRWMMLDGHNHLLVDSGNEYNATSGSIFNANFITGVSFPAGAALDGNNHLFVTDLSNNTVGEFDATTGASINAAFISGQGLNTPGSILFVSSVPEPSSLSIVALGVIGLIVRRRRTPGVISHDPRNPE